MAWWQLVCFLVIVAYAYNLGRHRRAAIYKHKGPALHDTEGMDRYVMEPYEDWHNILFWNLNGVPWDKAELPPLWHRCYAQTCTMHVVGMSHRDRCACGGERWGVFGNWTRRDSRCLPDSTQDSPAA